MMFALSAVFLALGTHGFVPVATPIRGATQLASGTQTLGSKIEQIDPSQIRCPFFRRRATDLLEAAASCGRWLAGRHKSIDLTFGLFPLTTLAGIQFNPATSTRLKLSGLSLEELARVLSVDFASRQAQVTGSLSREVFHEMCVFDGPDPDMPVKGIEKYLSASRNLFRHSQSRCDLLGIGIVNNFDSGEGDLKEPTSSRQSDWCHAEGVVVMWRIEGVINLPWHPAIKPYYGATFYQRRPTCPSGEANVNSLVTHATEWWSITALDAFCSTIPEWSKSPFASPPAAPASGLVARMNSRQILASMKSIPGEFVERVVFLEDAREQ